MEILYSHHAKKRMRQRDISLLEIEHVLKYPDFMIKTHNELRQVSGRVNNRTIKLIIAKEKKHIKIITVM